MRRVLLIAVTLLALLPLAAAAQQSAQARPELTAEQWREDLRFMAAELKTRHANLYHLVAESRVRRRGRRSRPANPQCSATRSSSA